MYDGNRHLCLRDKGCTMATDTCVSETKGVRWQLTLVSQRQRVYDGNRHSCLRDKGCTMATDTCVSETKGVRWQPTLVSQRQRVYDGDRTLTTQRQRRTQLQATYVCVLNWVEAVRTDQSAYMTIKLYIIGILLAIGSLLTL